MAKEQTAEKIEATESSKVKISIIPATARGARSA